MIPQQTNTAFKFSLIILAFIALATVHHRVSAQTLWIESGTKAYRECNQRMMHQTADTLYWYNSGFEAASEHLLYKIGYFTRNDSLFQKPLSKEVLYSLSSTPETLPDSLKGPFFLGVFQSDSLILKKNRSRGKYPRVLKKASPTNLSRSERNRLIDHMNNFFFEVNVNALTGSKGIELEEIKYQKNIKPSPHDPAYSPNGVYTISKLSFLHIPPADDKFFQVIRVDKKNIVVESVCGKRKSIPIERIVLTK